MLFTLNGKQDSNKGATRRKLSSHLKKVFINQHI